MQQRVSETMTMRRDIEMLYENIMKAVFLERPNRFIAKILMDGEERICHVKNTGRCRELLVPGAEIYVQHWNLPTRKTNYDLIAVRKGDRLINMDSAAPNAVFAQWVKEGGLFSELTLLKPEQRFGQSRFDFYIEADRKKAFAEIKGVTLEENGVVRFPDAPTERGVKHLNELIKCVESGFDAYIVFIIQMDRVKYFEPNWDTHRLFGETLQKANSAGVNLLALNCDVTENSIDVCSPVQIKI